MTYTAKINGVKTTATCFAFDECHKIYLIEDMKYVPEAIKYGYPLFPIDMIAQKWEECCPLRYIQTWEDFDTIIPQGCEKKKHHFHIYK